MVTQVHLEYDFNYYESFEPSETQNKSLLINPCSLWWFVSLFVPASQLAGQNFAAGDVEKGGRRTHVIIIVVVAWIVICNIEI